MKTHPWLSVATTFTMSLGLAFGQEQQTSPAPAPAPVTPVVTNAPVSATNKPSADAGKTARKPAPTAPTDPGPPVTVGPATAKQNNINVRGQPSIKSEVVNRIKRGDKVEVLEIVEQKPKPNEPDKWARVALPTNTAVWVHSDFIDPANKTVKPRRLNLRSGPSENFSVVGRVERGAQLKEIERKDDWIRVEPPPSAYGFIAAHLLTHAVAPSVVEVVKTEEPAPAKPPEVPPTTSVTPPPTDVAVAAPPVASEPTPATTTPSTEPPAEEEIKRVVSREGIVKRSVSIQAPTWFVLESPSTGKTVNYLFTPSAGVVLRDYFGQRVIVTGEEGLDERWPNTPVINVESIEVVP
jgi:uncharacterized protein YgiM (DUF1202 family)